MRLWSIHPKYLDAKGLVALWREALLAKAVLEAKTSGYTKHPQLLRFQQADDPIGAINSYLSAVFAESVRRGYNFDRSKFIDARDVRKIPVTSGQIDYEITHLKNKLHIRDTVALQRLMLCDQYELHPLFISITGAVESWEKI